MNVFTKARQELAARMAGTGATASIVSAGALDEQRLQQPLLFRPETGLIATLPMFEPFSSGSYEDLARLTVQTVNDMFPRLALLVQASDAHRLREVSAEEFASSNSDRAAAHALKQVFDRYGSDKATAHMYHLVYGRLMRDADRFRKVLEIGLGTMNPDVVSNMGPAGRPGASLRAFRDFLPKAMIFGADIDHRVLFEEERISTHHVDQNDLKSFEALGQHTGSDLDLVIDDGLHTPSANLAVVLFALQHLRAGGWLVIEDIRPSARPVWEVVSALMPADFDSVLVTTPRALMFVSRRGDEKVARLA